MFKKIFIGLVVLLIVVVGVFFWLGTKKKQTISRLDPPTPVKPVLLNDAIFTFDFDLSDSARSKLGSGPGVIVLDMQLHPPIERAIRFMDLGLSYFEVKQLPARLTVDPRPIFERNRIGTVASNQQASLRILYIPGGKPGMPVMARNFPYAYHHTNAAIGELVSQATAITFDSWDSGKKGSTTGELLEGRLDLGEIRRDSAWSRGGAVLAAERVIFGEPNLPKRSWGNMRGIPSPMEYNGYIPTAWVKVDLSKDSAPFTLYRDLSLTPSFSGPLTFRLFRCPDAELSDPFLCAITARKNAGEKKEYGELQLITPDGKMPVSGEKDIVLKKRAL